MNIIPLKHRRALRLQDPENAWRSAQDSQPYAEALLRYALMLNTLDARWLKGCMAPEITYESQSVFEILEGSNRVFSYLEAKMKHIADSGSQGLMIAEIAEIQGIKGQEFVVAIYQAKTKTDRMWREAPVAAMQIKIDEHGFINAMLMITAVPSPHLAKGLGITPGYAGGGRQSTAKLRTSADYNGLRLHLVQLDGRCNLDHDAETAMRAAAKAFPGSSVDVEAHHSMNSEKRKTDLSWSGPGYPCLGIFWNETFIGRLFGLRSPQEIMEKVRQYVN